MRRVIDYLSDLERMRQIAKAMEGKPKFNSLEEEFLMFSAYLPGQQLTAKLPRLYELAGEEQQHYSDALKALGVQAASLPKKIDFSGAFDSSSMPDAVIFLSLQQIEADHLSSDRSYLNPLLEKIYSQRARLVADFTLNEAVLGRVSCCSGAVELKELHLFPDRFSAGPYQLSAELDTPNRTIKKLTGLNKLLAEFAENPKESMLDPDKVAGAASAALELRQKLGSLSRYDANQDSTVQADANSCIARTGNATVYYLYEPKTETNIAVYFGEDIFSREPKGLRIMRGEDCQQTLLQLTECGIFELSPNILEQRIKSAEQMYETAARNARRALSRDYPEIGSFIESLKQAYDCISTIFNPEAMRKYISGASPELLEFAVYPKTTDPIVHELLPKLSSSKTIRDYHDSHSFMNSFENSDETARKEMLKQVSSALIFSNYQNNEVNSWLYQNHRGFCEQAGIKFEAS